MSEVDDAWYCPHCNRELAVLRGALGTFYTCKPSCVFKPTSVSKVEKLGREDAVNAGLPVHESIKFEGMTRIFNDVTTKRIFDFEELEARVASISLETRRVTGNGSLSLEETWRNMAMRGRIDRVDSGSFFAPVTGGIPPSGLELTDRDAGLELPVTPIHRNPFTYDRFPLEADRVEDSAPLSSEGESDGGG